jgi:phage terminase small subunit
MSKYQEDVDAVEAPERRLTARQERFIVEYLECQNGAEAARRAGYSEHTARQIATENLAKPYIKDAIQRKRDEIMSGTEDKVAWLVERLTAEAIDDDNGEATRVRALEVLGKVFGAFAPEKQEIVQFDGTFLADLDFEEEEKPSNINDLH